MDPNNLNWCVWLYEEIVPNADFNWNSVDELVNVKGLIELWWIRNVCFREPVDDKLLSGGRGGEKVSQFETGGEKVM